MKLSNAFELVDWFVQSNRRKLLNADYADDSYEYVNDFVAAIYGAGYEITSKVIGEDSKMLPVKDE